MNNLRKRRLRKRAGRPRRPVDLRTRRRKPREAGKAAANEGKLDRRGTE